MVISYGKYCNKTVDEVKEIDPQYLKWIASYENPPTKKKKKTKHPLEELSTYLKENKQILDEIENKINALADKNSAFLNEINRYIFMSQLTGNYRGKIFLESIKKSLLAGNNLSFNTRKICIDIISRGTAKKPIRRGSKKYMEKVDALNSHFETSDTVNSGEENV
jgi:hypothetical protein